MTNDGFETAGFTPSNFRNMCSIDAENELPLKITWKWQFALASFPSVQLFMEHAQLFFFFQTPPDCQGAVPTPFCRAS